MIAGTPPRVPGSTRRGFRVAGTALVVALTLSFGSACIDTGPSDDGDQQEQRDPGRNQDGDQQEDQQEGDQQEGDQQEGDQQEGDQQDGDQQDGEDD